MQEPFRQILLLKTPDQLAECLNPQRLSWLLLFLGRPLALKEAAREAGVPRTTLAHHVHRWVKKDLLQVDARCKTKQYCAALEGIHLSFETLEPEALTLILLQWSQLWQEKILKAGLDARAALPGVHFYRLEGHLHADFAGAPGQPVNPSSPGAPVVLLPSWGTELHLSYQEAQALQQDLLALREKYAGRSGQKYLLQVGLAPEIS